MQSPQVQEAAGPEVQGSVVRPYSDSDADVDGFVRTFSSVDAEELVWHRDDSDRRIVCLAGEGWQFQRENMLPSPISVGDEIIIEKGFWHRLILGNSDLILRIYEKSL